MNKILKLAVFLSLVSALAGGALSYVNQITAPIIQANNEAAEKASLLAMYPEASQDDFEILDVEIDSKNIKKVYQYEDCYIFLLEVSGYKEGTTFLVSIHADDHTIDNYQAISNGDTKGIGTQVLDEPFKDGLVGKDATGKLDTISGATVSSSAVVKGIHEAASFMEGLE